MTTDSFVISFPGASKDTANKYAQSLADELSCNVIGLERVEPTRENDETQDFGATLVLVLGTAAATAVAKGVQKWLARTGTTAELLKDGSVRLSNLESKDVAEIAKAFAKGH
jgi:hypothetical protein